MEDQDSQPAAAATAAAAPTSNRDGSPMPSLVATPSTNASLSPRTPASPPFTSVSDSPQKAFPRLNIGGTPAAGGGLDLSSTPIGGPTSPASDGAPPTTNNRYKSLADAFANRGPDGLVHDIAIDDLTIAEDGTYLETSSAHAARELKRRYDKTLGVGTKPGVRSPYAITVTQDAQGQPLYRLSSSRPGNGVSVTENEPTTSAVPEAMSKSRRLRLSVGALLTSKTSRSASAGPVQQQQQPSSSTSTTTAHANKPGASTPRKAGTTRLVRNVRSTSELRSRSGSGAANATARYGGKQSVSRTANGALDDSHLIARLAHDGDAFSVLLGWSTDPDNESVSSSKDSVSSENDAGDEARLSPTSTHVAHPFGRGVSFATPHKPLDFSIRRPASPPQLRYMQSFESGLTARADDHPTTLMRQFKRTTSATHASASPYSTEVFDVIQNYKGIPLADTLSAVASETVFKLSSTPSALPKNDPRFVIWGDVRLGGAGAGDDDDESNRSQSDASSPTYETRDEQQRRRRGSSVTESQSSATSTSGAQEPLGQRVIVAATIERWIAQLTSELNYVELLDFFLTYRVYITAIDLCHLLICRFHWAVEPPDSKQDEMVKKIVRVRTFIAFRYWLSTFFQVDFLRNRDLCKILTTWLNSLKADQGIVGQNQDVLDIVRKLKKVVRECKEKWVIKSSTSSTAGSSETRLSEQGGSGGNDEAENPDADVDLDMGEPPRPSTDGNSVSALSLNPPASYHSNQPMDLSSPSRPSDVSMSTISPMPLPSSSAGHPTTGGLSQLHDLQATILAQAKPAVHLKSTAVTAPGVGPTLPMHQSAISRALVNTMGRLGRWKRVLHGRSAVGVAACNDPAAFDLDWGSDSDREFGSIRPPAGASPNQRGAAFPSHTIPSSPPQRRLLGGSGWSTLSAKQAKKVGAEEDDEVVEEIAREAAAAAAATAGGASSSSSNSQAVVPVRRLLRTASAIPLNPKLLAEMGVEPSHPEMDDQHAADDESGPATPTAGAVPLTAAGGSTDSDNEPAAPPGLDVPSATPRRMLHRPSSSLSMRRVGEFKSSPLAPHPEQQSSATTETPAVVPEGDERSSMEENTGVPVIQEPIVPPGLSMPVQTPSVDVMDAHSAHHDDFDSLVDDDDDFHRRPEIVALDDFDLSSSGSDSDGGEPQRNRRQLRRLPNRRDFEFVRRSVDSVSSLGIRSSDAHSSIASGSEVSSRSRASQTGPVYEGEILPWHLDLIEDSDDDQPQDAEAALARLEGHLDATAQKEKLKKVDRWMKMVAARMAAGDTGFFFGDLKEEKEEEEEDASAPPSSTAASSDAGLSNPVSEAGDAAEPMSAGSSRSASVAGDQEEKPVVSVSIEEPASEASEDEPVEVHTPATDAGAEDTAYVELVHQQREALGAITPTPPPLNSKVDRLPLTPTLTSPGHRDDEGEAPPPSASTTIAETPTAPFPAAEIPQPTTRAAKRRGHNTSSLIRKADILLTNLSTSKIPSTPTIALHRSFILLHRSEALAQHFAMIDRELFLTVKFNEIVSGSWANPKNDVQSGDVLDWQAYIKERAKMKLSARDKHEGFEISAVAALRARFNMMVASAATDIVLSHPNERPVVFSKFLRIAWKSYLLNNFAAVVALITALQTPMVSTAMRRLWSRVGMWEMRVYEDLKEFSSPRGNFKFIRESIAAMVDRRDDTPNAPPSAHSSVSSRARVPVDKAVAPVSCIPFIGVYLSDLHRYRKLPDYIDPTSPSSRVIEGPNGQLSSPRHPEVFSTLAPLPPSVQLEPMANVQKQRLTAGTVKEIVAGQHLASKISFDLDRKLYQKCLRLKALPPDKLVDVAKTYGGEA